ncbi:hypothetical protein FRX31_020691 [Thalictrum thalictroides]|uniref:TF-B3 domain-containing protein n=1 Tax=Thalictrum thalictroides TaxID=46969 RepID=A0A7J6VX74_THATH|nr:hypothetical protein FRX31_020691 [Thalictrum thalictroides]
MKHLEKEESEGAVLEDTSGKNWYVEVFRMADDIILQNGWEKFLKDHSLGNYEFLVFSYAGGMCFKVQIFDKTGCEQPNNGFQEAAISSGGQKQDEFHEQPRKGFEYFSRKQGRPLKKLLIPALRRRGRPAIYSCFSHQFQAKACTKNPVVEEDFPERTNTQLWPRMRQSVEEQKPWKEAMFNPNAPYFVKCLTKSEMKPSSYYVRIPKNVNAYLPKWKTEVDLMNRIGKTWRVNFVPGTGFCGGWRTFLRDNHLKRGNICLFEFMGNAKICVHIFPIRKQS